MKKLIFLVCFFCSQTALADSPIIEDNKDSSGILPLVDSVSIQQKPAFGGFFFKPALSIEYSAPRFTQSGVNSYFKSSGAISRQISDLNNFAIGGNFRVHKFLGINANWAQGKMLNDSLQGAGSLSERAQFRFDQYNLSALVYVPAIENFFEIFAEGGVADMRSRLTYSVGGNNFDQKSHETLGFYGAGFQIILNDSDLIRVSWQKYAGRIALINSEFLVTRVGYLHRF
jgi:hypothetical protein